jgi:hypothetical protein
MIVIRKVIAEIQCSYLVVKSLYNKYYLLEKCIFKKRLWLKHCGYII